MNDTHFCRSQLLLARNAVWRRAEREGVGAANYYEKVEQEDSPLRRVKSSCTRIRAQAGNYLGLAAREAASIHETSVKD